jgi:hypothetical protein
MGLPQFGPCVIRVSGAGPSRARAIWGLKRSAEWMRREQPEVKPYCACESCACCGSVAVRRGGEHAWPDGPWAAGAGQCEGRDEPLLAGGVRDAGRGCAGLAGPTMCAGLAGPGRDEPGRAGPSRFRAGPYIYHEIPWSGWVGQNIIMLVY